MIFAGCNDGLENSPVTSFIQCPSYLWSGYGPGYAGGRYKLPVAGRSSAWTWSGHHPAGGRAQRECRRGRNGRVTIEELEDNRL